MPTEADLTSNVNVPKPADNLKHLLRAARRSGKKQLADLRSRRANLSGYLKTFHPHLLSKLRQPSLPGQAPEDTVSLPPGNEVETLPQDEEPGQVKANLPLAEEPDISRGEAD
jgi:hypothetical protein